MVGLLLCFGRCQNVAQLLEAAGTDWMSTSEAINGSNYHGSLCCLSYCCFQVVLADKSSTFIAWGQAV